VADDLKPEISADAAVAFDIDERFPVWTLGDVGKIVLIALLALFFFSVLTLMVASGLPAFRSVSLKDMAADARLAVISQLLAYLATFWFVYRLIYRHYGVPFTEAIHWRWPQTIWPAFPLIGVLSALLIQGISRFLPIPKQMPIDQFFRTPAAAWALAIFGTFLAPFAEELFFRGLLFPALARKAGLLWSLIITSFSFALLHAAQLGLAWAPVFVLFLVGLILTWVRAATRSLAASTLMHIGYNATLFGMLYVSTDGFRNLDKVVR
jgi:membrane protease YdiL (CAAX protease family)